MSQSSSQRKCDAVRLPGGMAMRLRSQQEVRLHLMEIDFTGARESVLSATLAAHALRLGRKNGPSPARFHAMALAERHWLVANLLGLLGSPTLEVVAVCVHCGELLELRLDLTVALAEAAPILRANCDGVVEAGAIRLRLPTAADVDAAEDSAALLRACLVEESAGVEGRADGAMDGETAERALREADPLGDLALCTECCQCGQPVRAEVDLTARWLRLQSRTTGALFEEIDTLARHYHWSESEILGLSPARRRFYLERCRSEVETAAEWVKYAAT